MFVVRHDSRLDSVVAYPRRKIEYFDEQGALVRTMSWSDIKEVDGRTMPTKMRIEPADDPGEFTEVTYADIDFDADIPEGTFSLQSLKR